MPSLPPITNDIFDEMGRALGASPAPTISGLGPRQPAISSFGSKQTRQMMRWLVPEQPMIEMYINPQSFKTNYKKIITKTRTKGGFTLQYWGEDLTSINISGTTGTSGIEGINVLYDVYRNEQLMFDPYALFLQAERDLEEEDDIFEDLTGLGGTLFGQIGNVIKGAAAAGVPNATRAKPTLASLAFTVELYWSGEVYRGFFESFSVDEKADNLGLFNYDMVFTVTQKRGYRKNFLGWHRSAVSGPSNSNPEFGTPYSHSLPQAGYITPGKNRVDQPSLGTNYPSIRNGLNSVAGAVTTGIINAFDVF